MTFFRKKNIYSLLGIIIVILVSMTGCDEKIDEFTRVDIYTDYSEELMVSDPSLGGTNENIRLRYSEDIDDKYGVPDSYDEWMASCKCIINYGDDKKEYHVVRYAFGNCTGFTDHWFDVYMHVGDSKLKSYSVLFNERQRFNANCLVLLLGDYNEDIYNAKEGCKWSLMVLDYENHKTYMKELSIHFNLTIIPEISLIDMTNDGKDDIVIISSENKRDKGVARIYSIENDSLLEIFEEYTHTKAYFEDYYNVTIENSEVGLKQTICLTDLCYQKKDLEEKGNPSKSLWKNKMLEKGKECEGLRLSSPEWYALEKIDHNTTRLAFEQWLYWGEKNERDVLCRVHTTLMYDQVGKCMRIGSVETEWNDNYEESDMMDTMYYLPFSPNEPG